MPILNRRVMAAPARNPQVQSADAGSTKKNLVNMFINTEIKRTSSGLSVTIEGDQPRTAVLKGIDSASVDLQFYGDRGQTHIPHSGGGGPNRVVGHCDAAGMLVAVADKARGIVFVDIAARDFLDGKSPPQRQVLSLEAIAHDRSIKGAAKKAGLDAQSLTAQLQRVLISDAFANHSLNTLAFDVRVVDKNGASTTLEVSTYLSGDLSKGVGELKLEALEIGVQPNAGWLLPPSASLLPQGPRE